MSGHVDTDSPPATSGWPALAADLSPGARMLVERAFADLGGARPVDFHVHVLGTGAGGTGVWAHPKFFSPWRPLSRLRARLIFKASGVTDESKTDRQYIARIEDMALEFPVVPRLGILAFDDRRDREGRADRRDGEFAVPNGYVAALAARRPDLFVPVPSIHPYRRDAVEELARCAEAGMRVVKWLPNAQLIDPSDPAIDPFYRVMAEFGMVLLCHTGREQSVFGVAQRLGNPLLLRRPLDLGVTVVMAHAGNHGRSEDLDMPERRRVKARNFDLWLRLMDDPAYRERAYGDIAMIAQLIRRPGDLRTLLERGDLHPRLVNGSDYPLPAMPFISPGLLQYHGFIAAQERAALAELKGRNALLFDFVLKHSLRHPETGARFSPEVFTGYPGLDRPAVSGPAAAQAARRM